MKLSELWLREWVDITLDRKALVNQITMAGLEVRSIRPVSNLLHGVVIGEVVECIQHPRFDKLWNIKVHVGSERFLLAKCNQLECRKGLKVAVYMIDEISENNFKRKTIKSHKKFSIQGMLCSYSDLGISNKKDIVELPSDAPINTDIRDYLKLDDYTIEIFSNQNRADCLSIMGIARDVAMLNKVKLNTLNISTVTPTIHDTLSIQIKTPDACPRYLGRIVNNIHVKALTPLWMKEKLRRCGICSINAIVDITNYVLLEVGQPMYAFDKNCIDGGIIVRMAKEGETLTLLNDNEIKLNTDTLVVSDHNKVLTIAGISGGKHSYINEETKNIFLECAFFNPLFIIGRARQYNLYTHTSQRYERGVDPELQYKAMERTTQLLIDICGGRAGSIINITNKAALPKQNIITLHRSKLDCLIGHHIDDVCISDILRRLSCNIIKNYNTWKVTVPSWRFDIEIEEDLIEEIIRVYGYDNIPTKSVKADLVINSHCETTLSMKRIKTLLNDKGYHEVITYSFVDPKVQQLIHPGKESLALLNPISNEMSTMRLSLWTGLLKTIIYNQNRQQDRVRIFEIGLRFVPDAQASLGVHQDIMLSGAVSGNLHEEHWDLAKNDADFYDVKGDLESVFDLTGKLSETEFRSASISALHPGKSAGIYLKGNLIGFIGFLHPELKHRLHLNSSTIIFELEWNKITDLVIPKAKEISHFPSNRRDIAIVADENIPAADILSECKKIGINQLVEVNLLDVYYGKEIKKGFKGLTISLILQDINRTLEEAEIAAVVSKCIKTLKERFQISLRD